MADWIGEEGFKNWSFMTVQLWGEFARGFWKLVVRHDDIEDGNSFLL